MVSSYPCHNGILGGWLLRELKLSRCCKNQQLGHSREEGTFRHRIKWMRIVARSKVSYCPFAMKEDNDSEDGRMPEANLWCSRQS